jgi:hypothetical protein
MDAAGYIILYGTMFSPGEGGVKRRVENVTRAAKVV